MTFIPLLTPLNLGALAGDAGADASPPLVERFARTDDLGVLFEVDADVDFTVNVFFVLAMGGLLQYVTYGSHSAIPLNNLGGPG
tara:strand:- start:349 stop:600 length:252 start_codon:yes stop_codon:yes gene_type:complete